MHDLVIIHSMDTASWKDFIRDYLGNEVFHKRITDRTDTELMEFYNDQAVQSEISGAKAIIIIASPLHLEFLDKFSSFNYSRFVTDIRRAQLLLCGINISDFDGPDADGVPISHRFPNFLEWKKVSHDQYVDLLRNAMVLMESEVMERSARPSRGGSNGTKRRRRKEFEVTPTQVKCKESTVVTILFEDSLTEHDEQVPLIVAFRVTGKSIKISATWRNPYVYQFVAPDLPPGTHTFTITAKGNEIGSKQLIYNINENVWPTSADLIQVYVDQMARLCSYICKAGLKTAEVDSLLAEGLDKVSSHSISRQVLEPFFGVHAHRGSENSSFEFPTILHLAASFGLHEFATKLIDLPGALNACSAKNVEGKTPENMAVNNSYEELALLLQDFRIINETIDSTYEVFLPDPVGGSYLSDSSDNSRTPTAGLSSSGSDDTYMTMIGSTKKKEEDSDSENGYVDIEDELQELEIHKQQTVEERHCQTVEQPDTPSNSEQREVIPQFTNLILAAMTTADDSTDLETDDSKLEGVPECQKELIEIINLVKQGKLPISEAEHLIKGWKFRHATGKSKSFKEKQHQLSKLRSHLSRPRDPKMESSCWESKIGLTIASQLSGYASDAVFTDPDKPARPVAASVHPHFSSEDSSTSSKNAYAFGKKVLRTDFHQTGLGHLEPSNDSTQRISNISGSSRESVTSFTSRASTSSGVDIDVADDENLSDFDSRQVIYKRGNVNMGGGARILLSKRQSKNLERLEEELTCLGSRAPPPVPPRANLGKQSPTISSPSKFISTQRTNPLTIALPPLREKCEPVKGVLPFVPVEICSRHLPPRKDFGQDTRTRRPLPPEPSEPSDEADQCQQCYTQVVKKIETIRDSDSGKVFRGDTGPKGEPRSPLLKSQPNDSQDAVFDREFSGKAVVSVVSLKATSEVQSKLRSCESFGSWESQRMREKAEVRAEQIRRTQTTPRSTQDGNEIRKIRMQRQANLDESCAQLSVPTRDTAKNTQFGSASSMVATEKIQQETSALKIEASTSHRKPIELMEQGRQPSSSSDLEFCQDYEASTCSSNQLLKKSNVLIDRPRDCGDVTAKQSFVKGLEKSKAVSDCNRNLLAASISEHKSYLSDLEDKNVESSSAEKIGSFQTSVATEPHKTYRADNDKTKLILSGKVARQPLARVESCNTDTAQCSEEQRQAKESIATANAQQQVYSEANRSFKEDKKETREEMTTIQRIQQQQQQPKSPAESRRGCFPRTPTVESEKALVILQLNDPKPEVAAVMTKCMWNPSYDTSELKDSHAGSPGPYVSTFARTPSSDQNINTDREECSYQHDDMSYQSPTTQAQDYSGVSEKIGTKLLKFKLPPPQKPRRRALEPNK